jgi:hypothetical protein
MQPVFEHDCTNCTFLGHYFDHDVYICKGATRSSIIGRYGNEGSQYASSPLESFIGGLTDGHRIGSPSEGWSMPYLEYLFSDKVCPYIKAWVLALTLTGAKDFPTPSKS